MEGIGAAIRSRRKKTNLTLRALAERIGVTSSFLSQVEKGKTTPSLSTLKKIADALHTTVSAVVAEVDNPESCGDRRITADQSLITQILTSPQSWKMMEPLLFRFTSAFAATEVRYRHAGDEFAIVLKGRLKVVLDDAEHVLEVGDSIYFNSGIPHVFLNMSDGETEVLSVNTPPNF
jgi:transcriptional regulator with XRE-family HTH domain